MNSVLTTLEEVRALFASAAQARAHAESVEEGARMSLHEIVRQIHNGEKSSGNIALDHTLLLGGHSDDHVARVQSLYGRMQGKKGQLVALVFDGRRDVRHEFGREWKREPDEYVRIGILGTERLERNPSPSESIYKNPLLFPCNVYVSGCTLDMVTKTRAWPTRVGNIIEQAFLSNIKTPMPNTSLTNIVFGIDGHDEWLAIGDDEVRKLLEKRSITLTQEIEGIIRDKLNI